jgi:hypothetical protein
MSAPRRLPHFFHRVLGRSTDQPHAKEPALLQGSETFEPAEGVKVSTHDGGLTLFNTRTGLIFTSNRTGSQLWRSLERHTSLETIASEISREYRLDHATALEHAVRFVDELRQSGLVKMRSSP